MKAEERFVNKEKLKLYLNVDDSDLRDVTPNHHNLKEVGKNAGLVLNIRWEKNMIYKSLTILTHFLIQTFLPIFRFKVHLSYASFKEVLGSLYVHLLCPAHSYLPFCYSCAIKISHQFCYSCAIKISAHHQVQLVLILVAGGDVIDGEIPRRSGEVENVNWNLEIFLPI